MIIDSTNEPIISIIFDTNSIETSLLSHDELLLQNILKYSKLKMFEIWRSAGLTRNTELQKIKELKRIEKVNESNDIMIEYEYDDTKKICSIFQNSLTINHLGKKLFKKEFKPNDFESLLWLFVTHYFCHENNNDIKILFITLNDTLLQNRTWQLQNLHKKLLVINIVEATIVMDLFIKRYYGEYYETEYQISNPGLWYLYSFRSKIPHYNVPPLTNIKEFEKKDIMEEFANRFTYLLATLDQLGIQYYFPKDSGFFTLYYYNYFISLVTGIFDSLAIGTKEQYNLKFEKDHQPTKTSLNSQLGCDFLRALKSQNKPLREHIHDYSHVIHLIYSIRELVIHREGFKNMGFIHNPFELKNPSKLKVSTYIPITKDIENLIKSSLSNNIKTEGTKDWGIVYDDNSIFLLPYKLSIAVTERLIDFCDGYLQLLGYPNFIESSSYNDMRTFRFTKIGF